MYVRPRERIGCAPDRELPASETCPTQMATRKPDRVPAPPNVAASPYCPPTSICMFPSFQARLQTKELTKIPY